MSYKCHVASKYDVDFGGVSYDWGDFKLLVGDLLDFADDHAINTAGYSHNDSEDAWEIDKSILKDVLEQLDPETAEEQERENLREFCDALLTTSDPNLSFVRIEAW